MQEAPTHSLAHILGPSLFLAGVVFSSSGHGAESPLGLPQALTETPGDAQRGEAIFRDRRLGNCLTCHRAPLPTEAFQGTVGPDLHGVGQRLSAPELRLRLVDARQISPDTIMPSYLWSGPVAQQDPAYAGKSLLTPQQIEDVLAYLLTLTEEAP